MYRWSFQGRKKIFCCSIYKCFCQQNRQGLHVSLFKTSQPDKCSSIEIDMPRVNFTKLVCALCWTFCGLCKTVYETNPKSGLVGIKVTKNSRMCVVRHKVEHHRHIGFCIDSKIEIKFFRTTSQSLIPWSIFGYPS